MKRIISLILILVCLMSLSSCFVVPVYDDDDLIKILKNCDYEIKDFDEIDHKGVDGCVYASKDDEELYYIYCKDYFTAKAIHKHINSELDMLVSQWQLGIKEIESKLNSPDLSAAEKGKYYEEYLIIKDRLEKVKYYSCGRGINVVWVGTKQAIRDIRFEN